MYSDEYLAWVNWMKINHPDKLPITNSQKRFVDWALKEENSSMIAQIGDMTTMFTCVRPYIRDINK